MRALTPRRPSHATVVAYVALLLAMSGTAYAAATVGSGDVVDDSLRSVDLKDGAAVRSEDVVNDSFSGGGLTGQDIREGTLKMPVGVVGYSEHVRVGHEGIYIPAMEAVPAALSVNAITADYRCPDFPAENDGTLYLQVDGPGDLFIDQGEPDPTYIRVPDQSSFSTQLVTHATGDAFTIQYKRDAGTARPVAVMTMFVFVVGLPGLDGVNHGSCHLQAQLFDATE
jgi:hypothetical protein